jgi:hypothetical protein
MCHCCSDLRHRQDKHRRCVTVINCCGVNECQRFHERCYCRAASPIDVPPHSSLLLSGTPATSNDRYRVILRKPCRTAVRLLPAPFGDRLCQAQMSLRMSAFSLCCGCQAAAPQVGFPPFASTIDHESVTPYSSSNCLGTGLAMSHCSVIGASLPFRRSGLDQCSEKAPRGLGGFGLGAARTAACFDRRAVFQLIANPKGAGLDGDL